MEKVGMLRLRSEDRFAIFTASLSMTGVSCTGGRAKRSNSRFLRFAVAFAPAPAGMTKFEMDAVAAPLHEAILENASRGGVSVLSV
jgi:hypothetical protein